MEDEARAALPSNLDKELLFVPGGPNRRGSVHNSLRMLQNYQPPWVLIHDGARPWVKIELIEGIILALSQHGAAIPLLPLVETPKEVDFSSLQDTGIITRHLKRKNLGIAQTPQGFTFPEILRAHERAAERESLENIEYTDDAEVWGEFIGPVAVIPGDAENRKITFPRDLEPLCLGSV
jgi:2-C-methyl-D-erythritol 4-phosphate cytidylyltransferase